jgi:glycerophosphoryl diester phosphodiesterase
MSLAKNIQKAIDTAVDVFIAEIAAVHGLPEEELREMWITAGKTKKTTRTARKTGYQLFSREVREELRRDDPSMPFGMISKTISLRWKAFPYRDEYNARARGEAVASPPSASPAASSASYPSSSPKSVSRGASRQKRGTSRGLAR